MQVSKETVSKLGDWLLTAIGIVILVRLAVAGAILAGKPVGWVSEGHWLDVDLTPLDLEGWARLALNAALIVVVVALYTRCQNAKSARENDRESMSGR